MVAMNEPTTQSVSAEENGIRFAVDAEHTGIRAVGCLTLLGIGVSLFLLIGTLTMLPDMVIIFASIFIAAFSFFIEWLLPGSHPVVFTTGNTLSI